MSLSFNGKTWLDDQESRGAENWNTPSKEADWYKCVTRQHLLDDDLSRGYYIEFGTAMELEDQIATHYRDQGYKIKHRKSIRAGFLPSDMFGIAPYSGQWGRGWILFTHRTASTVYAQYLLLTGGDPDVIADNYK